ncbi:MAG: hypothetical protein K0R70_317 [Steroidobacteraceae bacterium]|nr:hypothetical protein [Steroidobacteraceae bacterium]
MAAVARGAGGRRGEEVAAAGVLLLLAWPLATRADDASTTIELYGFVQADAIADIGGRLDPDWDDAFRPSRICIDGACGTDGQSSISIKQSRLGVKGAVPTGAGSAPVAFRFEFDLFGVGEDAGQTTYHVRHVYGAWRQLLAGRTYSLFMDSDASPSTLDYWGPPGMPFFTNVQFRWTPLQSATRHVAVAIERPGNDIDPGNLRLIEGLEGIEVQNDEEVPDLTAQFRHAGHWGHVQLAGILRKVGFELRAEDDDEWIEGSETGWGVNVGAVFNVLSLDKVLLQLVHGEGIASYMNDGGMDLAPRAIYDANDSLVDVEAEAIPLTGALAYYEHHWNDRWSTSTGYSYTEVDNTNFQDAGSFHKGEYASINLVYFPADNLMFGAEGLWGSLTRNDGAADDDVRVQFTAKFTFGTRFGPAQ